MKLFIEEATNCLMKEDGTKGVKVADWVVAYIEENCDINYVVGFIEVSLEDFCKAQEAYLNHLTK